MSVNILKLVNKDLIPMKLEEFAQLTLREAIGSKNEYLLKIGRAYVATGDLTLLAAQKKNPEAAFLFHEMIKLLLPNWTSDLLDMRIVDLPIIAFSEQLERSLENAIMTVKETFAGARVLE